MKNCHFDGFAGPHSPSVVAVAVAAFLCSITAHQPIHAQTVLQNTVKDETSGAFLPTMMVTATRSEIDTSDSPAAATITTSKDITARNVSRISDALAHVPSLYLGASSNGQIPSFTGNFSLRGMDASRTLVLIDGVQPLQNANSQRVNWLTLSVDDIDRVEVVPGAFSSLYGSNAMGGVINVISKSPGKRELTVRLKKGFDDAAGEDASVYFRDKFSTGLGITASLSRNRRDGYISDYVVSKPATGVAGTPVSGAQASTTTAGEPAYIVGNRGQQPWLQNNASIKLSYDISSSDRLYVGFAQADAEAGFNRFNTYLTNTATGVSVSSGTLGIAGKRVTLTEANFLGNSPLIDSSKRWFAGYEGLVGKDMKLKVDVAQINRENSFPTSDPSATWNAGLGKLTNAPDSGLDGVATLSFPLGGANFMVTGVSLHSDSVKRTSYTLSNWRDADSKTAVQDQYNGQSSTTSLFAQDEITATDRLTIYVGGRFDQWETSGDFLRNTAPATTASYLTRTQTSFNPKVAGVYKPVDALTLRASVGKSFRAPTIFEMYSVSRTAAGVVTQGDPSLKSERGRSWELGGEWRVNERLKTSTTYYETSLDDMIYIQAISPTLKQRLNAGKTKVRGLELGAVAQLNPWFAINTNVSWIDSLMLENTADPTSVGKQLTDVPNRLAYLGLTASAGQWSGTLEARYTGKVYSTAGNTDSAVGVFGSYDANTMINLKAGYQVDKATRFNLAVNNLFDYQAYQYSLLPGRNVTAELVMSF